jgi:3-deoxy-manno-octulosonate cytidylyltransferase (CMP-KDO synthetase)
MTKPFHIIIPARLASSRLPGKLLLKAAGKTIIQHVYDRVKDLPALSVTIATDSADIYALAKSFKADVLMTDGNHPSGTDRIAEAARVMGLPEDAVIVNVQGDEPQMQAPLILQVANLVQSDWASLYWPIDNLSDFNNPNVVKVVVNQQNQAMYFSRSPIPFVRDNPQQLPHALRHIGIYAYRMNSLQAWVNSPASSLERYECLEQLRALDLGMKIDMQQALVAPGQDINTHEDYMRFTECV